MTNPEPRGIVHRFADTGIGRRKLRVKFTQHGHSLQIDAVPIPGLVLMALIKRPGIKSIRLSREWTATVVR